MRIYIAYTEQNCCTKKRSSCYYATPKDGHVAFGMYFMTFSITFILSEAVSRTSVSLKPLSGPLLYISYMQAVWYSSAVMKDATYDKCTDHKQSNHSRTCLRASPLVMLCTLSFLSCLCTSLSALCMPAVVRVHYDGS